MNKHQSLSRRAFLRQTALAAGGLTAAPLIISRADAHVNANDRIVMGAIGVGGRGRYILSTFLQYPDVQMVAVCDARSDRRRQAQRMVNEHYDNEECATYIDMREMLARTDIDAVMIATGDNNHALASILAARAGKDIFCEKPSSVTIQESRLVADTVKRHGLVFQCGTQRRNISNFAFAAELARSGLLGRIKTMYAERAWQDVGVHFQVLAPQPEPPHDHVAWDHWLGVANWRPFNADYMGRFWRRHGDFSGGSITEWGSHTVDICQWALNADDTTPISYEKIENNDVEAIYANGTKLVITRGLRFGSCPVRIEGEDGWVETGDDGEIETYPASLLADRQFSGGYPADNHVREFLNCIKSRQQPRSDAEASHRSISACHCANIAVRLQRPVKWDPDKEAFIDDDEANRLRSRAFREPWMV